MSPSQTLIDSDRAGRMTARAWVVLLVMCGAIFLEGLDVSMMGVALPAIQADLGMSTSSLQWVVSAYVLGYGGFMLLGGRAADLLGRRRMFLLWLSVFIAFSGLGGLATESWMIVLARFVTGVAAAFMTPAGLSIITTSFPEGPVRNRALLIYSATAAAGFSLGLVVGGLLTEIDWRWVFFAPVIVSGALLAVALRVVPADNRPAATAGGFDVAGAVSATAAMLLFAYAVVNAPEVAWSQTAVTALGGLAALGLFVRVERRTVQPLVRLGIFRSGTLVRANLGALLFAGSFMGFQFLLVLYLQQVRGWSSLETGLALLVAGIDAFIAPTLTPRLVNRFGVTRVILGGLLAAALAYALFLRVDLESRYLSDMLPTMILLGIAFALAYGPLTIAATGGIDADEQGLAGGLLYSSWQFGSALGLAVATATLVSVTGSGELSGAAMDGFTTALVVPVVAALLSAVAIAFGLGRGERPEVEHRRREVAGSSVASYD